MKATMSVTQRLFGVCLLLASTSASAGNDGATPVACGDLLMTPGAYVLTADLVCDPPAVVILAGGVHLNLNGYSITNALPISDVDQAGVVIAGTDGHVVNGTLSGFELGVLITGNDNKVSEVTATGNLIGIFLCCGATGNRVVGNTANGNVSLGDVVGVGIQDWDGGRNNVISGNTANENDFSGILISDSLRPPVKGDKITGNVANYNGEHGIMLFEDGANGNVVRGNELVGNTLFGIVSFSYTDFPIHNLIQGNTALDSGNADIADFAPVCENAWKSNTFSTEISVAPGCTD
jgi:parallel beta-helix repeat protein